MQNFLKRLRKERGVTLKRLAAESGFGVSTINNFENGRAGASPEFLRRISETLGVSVDSILGSTKEGRTAEEPDSAATQGPPRFNYSTQEGAREAFEWLIEHMPLPKLIERLGEILNDHTTPAEGRLAMARAILPTLSERLLKLRGGKNSGTESA